MMSKKVLSLGWGVQSWTLAAMAALGEIEKPDYVIHSDTTFEREETYQFAAQWSPWLAEHGIDVVTVSDPNAAQIMKLSHDSGRYYTLMPVFTYNERDTTIYRDEHGYEWIAGDVGADATIAPTGSKIVSQRIVTNRERGQLRRQCTARWKIDPLQKYLKSLGVPLLPGAFEMWLGISTDEWTRAKDSMMLWITNKYPLLDLNMSRNDCLAWLRAHGLPSPGKSACKQCMFHSPAYWRDMKKAGGPNWDFSVWADNELRRDGREWFLHSSRLPLEQAVVLADENKQPSLIPTEDECDSGHCFL